MLRPVGTRRGVLALVLAAVPAAGCSGCGDNAPPLALVPTEAGPAADAWSPPDATLDAPIEALADADPESSDGPLDPDAPWPVDPDGWLPMGDEFEWVAPCKLSKADLNKVEVPGLEWKPCGEGCEIAELGGGIQTRASWSSGGGTIKGIPYAQVWNNVPDPPRSFGRLVNLLTGEVLHAFRLEVAVTTDGFTACGIGRSPHSPALMAVSGPGSKRQTLIWNWDSNTWANTYPPDNLGAVSLLDGIGALAFTGMGYDIYVSMTTRPTDFQRVFNGNCGDIPARGDQIVFPDWRGVKPGVHGKIGSWTPSTGVEILYAGDDDPLTVGLSDTHIVWTSVPQMNTINMERRARFYWSPRATSAAAMNVHQGPIIPKDGGSTSVDQEIKTHGDFAAVLSVVPQELFLDGSYHDHWVTAVTRFSTGEVWMVKATLPDHAARDVWAVTDTHVYVAETNVLATGGMQQVSELVRYSLDKLDVLQNR